MSASATTAPARAGLHGEQLLRGGIAAFALYHLVLAVWMAAAPHSFYTAVGPFGTYNAHYIRDTATFNAALAAGLGVSVRRHSWRIPMLAVTTLQFALHSLNHLADIDGAHPAWTGWFDFFSLLAATLLLAALLARARAGGAHPPHEGGTP